MIQPILVCMSWRGGQRFERCLTSIAKSEHHFKRILLSITSAEDSDDMKAAKSFQEQHPQIEVICTGKELPTMQHQAFWVDYLERTDAQPTDWIYWLAYDDEVKVTGIDAITDDAGNWPLEPGTVYFGPWAMRHEQADELWHGDPSAPLESWTSFPRNGPTRLSLMQWIADQLRQPTYMQMSGSLIPFRNFIDVRDGRPIKRGPMRIEMAAAASRSTDYVAEFTEPVSIIYGRSNSDRATYGRDARKEDLHLLAWLLRYVATHPRAISGLCRIVVSSIKQRIELLKGQPLPEEEWRVRGIVLP